MFINTLVKHRNGNAELIVFNKYEVIMVTDFVTWTVQIVKEILLRVCYTYYIGTCM